MNQEYVKFLESASGGQSVNRIDLIIKLFEDSILPRWQNTLVTVFCLGAAGFTLILGLAYRLLSKDAGFSKSAGRMGLDLFMTLAFSLISLTLWFILMPEHARFHPHFLPRHSLAPITLIWIGILSVTDGILVPRRVRA